MSVQTSGLWCAAVIKAKSVRASDTQHWVCGFERRIQEAVNYSRGFDPGKCYLFIFFANVYQCTFFAGGMGVVVDNVKEAWIFWKWFVVILVIM